MLDVLNYEVARILINNGNSVDIIFRNTHRRKNTDEAEVKRETTDLTGFSGATTPSLGIIKLPVQADGVNKTVEFLILDCLSLYKIILGRPWIHDTKVVPSSYCQCILFPTRDEIREIRGS